MSTKNDTWVDAAISQPEIIPFSKDTKCGSSPDVLTYNKNEDYYTVQNYRRGGRGDDSTIYWSEDDDITHWQYMTKP